MLVVTSPDVVRHDPPYEVGLGQLVSPVHERPERVQVLTDAFAAAGLPSVVATGHDEALLRRVHDPALVDWLRDGYAAWRAAGGPEVLVPDTFAHRAWTTRRPPSPIGAAGWWVTDTATPIVAGSWAAALGAVDVALSAAALALEGTHGAVHGLTRPPGHHAGRAYVGGFCLVNHAAIAAEALVDATDGGRVAVLDVDHHHGNGTQELFWDRDDVLYASLHADPAVAYPWFTGHADERGAGAGAGATVNRPLPLGTDDGTYLAVLDELCAAVHAHRADALVVSLGVDTAAGDPVGGLGLSPAAYAGIGARIAALGLPTVTLQEGGYALDRIGLDTTAVLEELP